MPETYQIPNEAFDEYFALTDAYQEEIKKRNKPGLQYDGVTKAHEFALAYMECRRLEEILAFLKRSQ